MADMADEKKINPGLVLVRGGKAPVVDGKPVQVSKAPIKPGASGKGADSLTAKQNRFAELVAGGETLVGAYRGAYDASKMAQRTVENEASKLRIHHGVSVRIDALCAAKAAKTQAAAAQTEAKAADRIWRGVWDLAEGAETPPAVRASALGLAAKMAGMLTEKVQITNTDSAKDIEHELMERLSRYK